MKKGSGVSVEGIVTVSRGGRAHCDGHVDNEEEKREEEEEEEERRWTVESVPRTELAPAPNLAPKIYFMNGRSSDY